VRRVSILGLCVVAILAVVAVVAGTASAAGPEWGQCFAKTGGKYTNANCTTKGKGGSFEWRKSSAVAKKGFTGAGGAGILDTETHLCSETCINDKGGLSKEGEETSAEVHEYNGTKIKVECTSEHAVGEASGTNDVKNVKVTFNGCIALGQVPCSNTANAEEIVTSTLKGELGFINKANNEVGVLLEPAVKKGLFANFACSFLGTDVGVPQSKQGPPFYEKTGNDQIISPVTPVNEMSSSFTQVYSVNEHDENVPNKFEGKKLSLLEDAIYNAEKPQDRTIYSPAGEEITNVNTPEEAVEIKA
jgi:hypothetical protein